MKKNKSRIFVYLILATCVLNAGILYAFIGSVDDVEISTVSKRVPDKVNVIVVDPGHGGKDSGAVGRKGLKEKHVTLAIAKILRDHLKNNGFRVYLTRETDEYVSLEDRAEFVNRVKADLFVSIHVNAHRSKTANGYETFYLSDPMNDAFDPNLMNNKGDGYVKYDNFSFVNYEIGRLYLKLLDSASSDDRSFSIKLADRIHISLRRHIRARDRGVKRARFSVLKNTSIPAVLIEVGFISNPGEEAKLSMKSHKESIAKGIAEGIIEFNHPFFKSETVTSVKEKKRNRLSESNTKKGRGE